MYPLSLPLYRSIAMQVILSRIVINIADGSPRSARLPKHALSSPLAMIPHWSPTMVGTSKDACSFHCNASIAVGTVIDKLNLGSVAHSICFHSRLKQVIFGVSEGQTRMSALLDRRLSNRHPVSYVRFEQRQRATYQRRAAVHHLRA